MTAIAESLSAARVPPQNLDAEESVLGAMMLSPSAIEAVVEVVDAGDFYRESHGTIYKADDGDTYHATLQMLPSGKLLVRGYVGMPLFGSSQTWARVDEKNYPACKP